MKNEIINKKRFVTYQNIEYEVIVFNRFDSISKPIDFIATVDHNGTHYCLFNAEDGIYAVMKDSNYFFILSWLEEKYPNVKIKW